MPSSFSASALGDVAHIEMGQSPDSSTVLEGGAVGMPFLQGNAEFGDQYPAARFSCSSPTKTCRTGDVLISVRAPVGALNLADREYCIGRGLAAIRIAGMSPTLAASLIRAAAPALRRVAQGTTFEAISKSDLASLVVLAPPQEDREVLGCVLESLDTTIRRTEAIIAKLKQVKQGLLHDLLTRGIDANGELRPPQSEAPHLYKDSPLGWVPNEWDCESVSSRLAVLGGKRLPAGHQYAERRMPYRYLRVTDFFEREYSIDDLESLEPRTFEALQRYEIAPGQLYISIAGSLGHVGVHSVPVDADVRVVLTENAARLVPLTELSPDFVAAYLNSQMVQEQIEAEKGTGGGVPKLALFRIEQFKMAWPSMYEQKMIVERLGAIDHRIRSEARDVFGLNQLKSGLMDDLLTGRVRVTPLLGASSST